MADSETQTSAPQSDEIDQRLAKAFERIEAETTPDALEAWARSLSGDDQALD